MFPETPRGRLQMHIFDIPGAEPPVRKNVQLTGGIVVPGKIVPSGPGKISDGERIMATQQPRLPARFPVGTRYIVEGEPAKGGKMRIVSRYLVMPSGVRYDLMNTPEPGGKPGLARKSRLRSTQRRVG
jgi:hypothetical protein